MKIRYIIDRMKEIKAIFRQVQNEEITISNEVFISLKLELMQLEKELDNKILNNRKENL